MEIKTFWGYNNSKHHEDQIDFLTIGKNDIFMIADGVSDSGGSRVASTIACKYAKEYLENTLKDQKTISTVDLMDIVEQAIETIASRMREEFQRLTAFDWKDIIMEYSNKFNEDHAFIDNYIQNIIDKIKQNVSIRLSTTFALMIINREISYLCTAVLGDPIVIIIREDSIFYHYASGSSILKNYLSLGNGVVGSIDICSRKIYKGDTIVMGSDGADIFYKRDGGFSLALFKSTLKNKNSNDPANKWLQVLQSENAINDDFSLFIIKIY